MTTEVAVCLPIILLIFVGCIEVCGMIYLKQAVSIAAYEGARTANAMGATTEDVESTCHQVLVDRGIIGGSITTSPSEVASVSSGDHFTVTCTAPCAPNSLVPLWAFEEGTSVEGSATYRKKF